MFLLFTCTHNSIVIGTVSPVPIAFRKLLDNYETETGKPEEVTEEEEAENWHFLDVIMETEVMQEAHSYLVSKNRAPDDVQEFKELLHKLWFRLYKRLREDRYVFFSFEFELFEMIHGKVKCQDSLTLCFGVKRA